MSIGTFFIRERERRGLWLKGFFAFLALCLTANVFLRPVEPHFVYDAWFGFWAVFGLGAGVTMIFVMKRVIQPLIVRGEDYYNDI